MLSQAIQHYVDMRRTCGFKFEYQASFLRSFLSFAEARGDQHVRINTAIEWADLGIRCRSEHTVWGLSSVLLAMREPTIRAMKSHLRYSAAKPGHGKHAISSLKMKLPDCCRRRGASAPIRCGW